MAQYLIEPSDFMDGWLMVQKAGEQTQHFRTKEEAERYVISPDFREEVQRRNRKAPGTNQTPGA